MIFVRCPCGAETKMAIITRELFHLGSGKDHMGKYYINNTKHEPVCLWCGYKFEKVEESLGGSGE